MGAVVVVMLALTFVTLVFGELAPTRLLRGERLRQAYSKNSEDQRGPDPRTVSGSGADGRRCWLKLAEVSG